VAAGDRVRTGATLGSDQQVAGAYARAGQRRGGDAQHDVVARMRIAGRQAVSDHGAPTGAEAGGDESQALDSYVLAVRQARVGDEATAPVGGDRKDASAVLVGSDQIAGEPSECRRGDSEAALHLRSVVRECGDHAAAVDLVDGRL
jgi:hypothetical protein